MRTHKFGQDGFKLSIALVAFLAIAASFLLASVPVSAAKKSLMSTPTLTCGTSSKVSIQITVTAGSLFSCKTGSLPTRHLRCPSYQRRPAR